MVADWGALLLTAESLQTHLNTLTPGFTVTVLTTSDFSHSFFPSLLAINKSLHYFGTVKRGSCFQQGPVSLHS